MISIFINIGQGEIQNCLSNRNDSVSSNTCHINADSWEPKHFLRCKSEVDGLNLSPGRIFGTCRTSACTHPRVTTEVRTGSIVSFIGSHWTQSLDRPCLVAGMLYQDSLHLQSGSSIKECFPTVCFLDSWPQTKCRVTFDTCFWHSFLCSFIWYFWFCSPW